MQETRYQKQNKRDLAKQSRIRVRVVALIVAAFFIVGLLIPLRPEVSEAEKRTLATFPEFSIASVADGSYFTELETWYSETYPLRDIMIKISTKWQRLYGIRSTALYGNAFVPFLVDHYQDVYVVDHRHYRGDLTSFIKENDIDDVIFMSHMAALTKGGAQSIINIFP